MRGRDPGIALEERLDAIGRHDFECSTLGRCGGSVRILSHEQRPGKALASAIFTNRLRDGEDMGLGESSVERCAAMSAGAEADKLVRVRRVGLAPVVIALKLSGIDE